MTDGVQPPAGEAGPVRGKVLRATAWTVGSYVAGNLLRLVSNLILARLLFPEAFALLALAGILAQGLKMFSDIGIGPSIIQSRSGEDQQFLNTAWTIQVIRGAWLFAASCLCAYPFSYFYETPDLLWIIPAIGLQPLISGWNSTGLFSANRKLDLARVALLALGESIVKLVVTVTLAIVHPSVWAIVVGVIVSQICYTVASHLVLPSHPHKFALNREATGELFRFGVWVFMSTVVTFFAQQADRLILGKLVSLDMLGVFTIALMFSRLPFEVCSVVTSRVLFPSLAAVFRDRPELMATMLRRRREALLTIGAATTLGFMTVSPWFFFWAYDQRYGDAMWMSPCIGLAMWFSILQASADRALLAKGDTLTLFRANLANFVATVLGCIAGYSKWGMGGFILGIGVGNLAGHSVVLATMVRQRIVLATQDLRFTLVITISSVMFVAVPWQWTMDLNTAEGLSRLVMQGSAGAITAFIAGRRIVDLVRGR